MQLHDSNYSKEVISKTILLLLAVGLNGMELFIPRIPFFPWFKPGFANIITIIWIIRYGTLDAILFTILRSWIAGFYFGFSLIAMVLSLSGGIAATVATGVAWAVLGKKSILGTVGLAITGALVHNTGQLIIVYALFMKNDSIFYQIPFMMIASLVFGVITGLLVNNVKSVFESKTAQDFKGQITLENANISWTDMVLSLTVLAVCISLFFAEKISIILTVAVTITIIAFFIEKKQIHTLIYPLKFKYLLLLIFLSYVCFTGGKRVLLLPFGTEEGFHSATMQVLRLWVWIEAGIILNKLKCNKAIFLMLRVFFPRNEATLYAGVLSIEYFPEIIRVESKKTDVNDTLHLKNPLNFFKLYLNGLFQRIENLMFCERV